MWRSEAMKAIGPVGVALLSVVATGCQQGRRPANAAGEVPRDVLDLADGAVREAKAEGIVLDYSVDSVADVEKLLALRYTAGALSEDERIDVGMRYGAYVGEVIRRRWGGSWSRDHPQVGANSYPLHSGENDVFPMGWCVKRLMNGPEDNVWNKAGTGCPSRMPRRCFGIRWPRCFRTRPTASMRYARSSSVIRPEGGSFW
jgi:hypothetical protein